MDRKELVCFHSCQSGIFCDTHWVSLGYHGGEKKSTQVFTLNKACGQGLYPTLQLLIGSKEAFPIMGNKDLIAEDYFFFFPFFCLGYLHFCKVSQS
jgi:hypothetical protein